jgi:DNA-binding transcriptional ArsR family regulator
MFVPANREEVRRLTAEGLRPSEIAQLLGISRASVSYHRRRLGLVDDRFGRRYSWQEVQEYYDQGHSVRECQERFGFSTASWHAARCRGEIVARPQRISIEELLGAPRNRTHLKKRLYDAGLKEPRCERCGLEEWLGERLSMALHHVNGDGSDNRLENLQILCPNCHSQTDNFSGRNRRRPLAVPAALS